MGYRVDVLNAVALDSKENLEKLVALYKMNPLVQQYDAFSRFWEFDKLTAFTKDVFILHSLCQDIKWYSGYDDVKCIEHMQYLCEVLSRENEEFVYSFKHISIPEDADDVGVSVERDRSANYRGTTTPEIDEREETLTIELDTLFHVSYNITTNF